MFQLMYINSNRRYRNDAAPRLSEDISREVKMKNSTGWMIALCMLSATACADRTNQSTSTASDAAPVSTGSMMAGPTPQQAQTSYGVVQAIDQLQRQDAGLSAMGTAGAAAAGGSMGAPTDKVYRVMLRMDDGSNQMVVEESMPSYKVGDRVRYSNGSVRPY
jgi:outer membrane lipoprotein SlyB